MHQASQLAPGPIYKGEKPTRNPLYTRFIKRFPCIFCGTSRDIDPMHVGPHAFGRKGSDLTCLPGCRACHREFDADPRGFAAHHGLDIAALIAKFNALWEARQQRRSA